jgi:thymidylate synthase (FAD)
MFLIKPSFKIIEVMGWYRGISRPLSIIEEAGRTCYKSEDKVTDVSNKKFVASILKRGHESVIEHSAVTVKIVCDRGVTHELVRHRLAAYSQESTRYCNYKGGVTFVIPPWLEIEWDEEAQLYYNKGKVDASTWIVSMLEAEESYLRLLDKGWSPQQARSVLPNSTKTEIVVTANFREWRHIFKLRCSKAAHPQMREIMIPLLKKFQQLIPVIFDDIEVDNV